MPITHHYYWHVFEYKVRDAVIPRICSIEFSCIFGDYYLYSSLAGVLVMTQIINPFRTIPFNLKDQFGLGYGGLRGAISFALVFTLPDNIERKQLFVTATIVIIIFTVFIQVRGGLHYIYYSSTL